MEKNNFLALPVNRKQQFKFLYKTNGSLIFKLSFLLFFFVLPLVIQFVFLLLLSGPILNNTSLSSNEIFNNLCNLIRVISLFFTLTIPILYIGLNGVCAVLKNVLYNEGFLLFRDFKIGLKSGIKSLHFGIIYGFVFSLLTIGLFSLNAEMIKYYYLMIILFLILIFIILNMFKYTIHINTYYISSFSNTIKSSFILVISSLPKIILINLLYLPLIICFVIDFFYFTRLSYLTLSSLLIYLFFLNINNILVEQLFRLHHFDETLNVKDFKDFYRKGLFESEANIDE